VNLGITFLIAFLLLPCQAMAQGTTMTFLEGKVWLIRGPSVLPCSEGMRLLQEDILETTTSGFAQIEFNGGTIVALGPASQMLLFRAGATGGELVLLSGWLKGETSVKGGPFRYYTTHLGAAAKDGTLVLHGSPNGAEIFVESGSGTVYEMTPQGVMSHSVTVKSGQFLSRKSGKNVLVGGRPDPVFLESLPQAFRDTLPSHLAAFQGKKPPPAARTDHQVTYKEIQPWLTIGQAWRGGFVERFKPRLKDPEFRRGVEDHLDNHPEWDVVLHPEKYANGKQGAH
jgi:hypothetical protein